MNDFPLINACLDTASSCATFSLHNAEGKTLFSRSENSQRGASQLLPAMLVEAAKEGFSSEKISHWRVGVGPGSYTGTRVGISFLLGLNAPCPSKLSGSNSGFTFLPAALEKWPKAQKIAVLHDGRRSEVILNPFELNSNGQWISTGECAIFTIVDELSPELAKFDGAVSVLPAKSFAPLSECEQEKIISGASAEASGLLLDTNEFDEESERLASLSPIYVRPAVFVDKKTFRTL